MTTSAVPPIDYTARDFSTIKAALLVHVQHKFPDTWRDFYESGMGTAWLELVAYVFDVCSFYLDYQANETYLPTARDRESVLNIGKLVGYKLRTATSASVTAAATLATQKVQDVIIPVGTEIQATTGSTFRTLTENRILASTLTSDVVFTEGSIYTDTFVSDGTSFQKFKLTTAEVIYQSEDITVGGEDWELAASLVYGSANSKIYTVDYDDDNYAYIQFGDDTSGAAPDSGKSIVVNYRVGGGTIGNVPTGDISGTVQGYLDGISPVEYVTVTILNAERGSGGEERETAEHAKMWIPEWVKSNQRAITLSDFNVLANTFSDTTYGAPAYANAKLKQIIPELNTVEIYVWGRDMAGVPTTASAGLKAAMSAYFNNNGDGAVRSVCTDVDILDGENIWVNMNVRVGVDGSYATQDVTDDVTVVIDAFFSSSNTVPGTDFYISHLYEAVQAVAGVVWSNVDELSASLEDTELIGVGDAATTEWTVKLDKPAGNPDLVPKTVEILVGSTVLFQDNGNYELVDDSGVVHGTVWYKSESQTDKDIYVWFDTPPAADELIYCRYQYVTDVLRSEIVQTMLTTTGGAPDPRIAGKVTYPPIVARDTVTNEKGIAFSDGTQVVYDDGSGQLEGDVLTNAGVPITSYYVDYSGGGFLFQFENTPAVGTDIRAVYRQFLGADNEDLPITDDQVPVKGVITITTETVNE